MISEYQCPHKGRKCVYRSLGGGCFELMVRGRCALDGQAKLKDGV